jgi:hypothetical protein
LFELSQSGGGCDDTASKPQRYSQTKPTPIGNYDEIFDLVDKTLAALAITMQGVVNFFNVTPNQGQLGLYRVRHIAIIRRRHESPQTTKLPDGRRI